jgi:hypothetical protein
MNPINTNKMNANFATNVFELRKSVLDPTTSASPKLDIDSFTYVDALDTLLDTFDANDDNPSVVFSTARAIATGILLFSIFGGAA